MTIAVAKLGCTLKLDDGRSFVVFEGDVINDLTFKAGTSEKTITGAVRVICATTKAQSDGPDECPPEPYVYKSISTAQLVIDSSDENHAILDRVNVSDILDIGSVRTAKEVAEEGMIVTGAGDQYKPLAEVLASAPAGSVIKLVGGTYETPMTLDKDISICADGDVTLACQIDLKKTADGAGPKVNLDGLVLSDAAVITSAGTAELTLTNCIIGGFDPEKSTQPIHFLNSNPDPILVTIEDCEFLANNENCYNLINIYAPFKDGSSISRNIFRKGCITHNVISFFAVEDGATVYFSDNLCEYSANMVHVQIPGSPVCTIMMEGNTYLETDPTGEYGGLFIVQPFADKTVTYEGVTIHCNDTKNETDNPQIGYIYMHSKNTQLTEEQYPTVFMDGVQVKLPVCIVTE